MVYVFDMNEILVYCENKSTMYDYLYALVFII